MIKLTTAARSECKSYWEQKLVEDVLMMTQFTKGNGRHPAGCSAGFRGNYSDRTGAVI